MTGIRRVVGEDFLRGLWEEQSPGKRPLHRGPQRLRSDQFLGNPRMHSSPTQATALFPES